MKGRIGFPERKISLDQARDTGLAMVLILLLAMILNRPDELVLATMVVLVLTMVRPVVFKPLAHLWFGLSRLIGSVVSKVLLSLIYYLVLTPMGLVRRALGADPMDRKKWKTNEGSVFRERNHSYSAKDMENPY